MYFYVGLREELESLSAVAVHPESTRYIVQHEPLVCRHAFLPCHCHLHSVFAQQPWWCVNKWFNINKFKDSEMNFEWMFERIFEKVIEFDDDKIIKYSFFIFTAQWNSQWIMWMYNSHYNIYMIFSHKNKRKRYNLGFVSYLSHQFHRFSFFWNCYQDA